MLWSLLLWVFCLLFSGCGSLRVLHREKEFTRTELLQGGLAIAGVVRMDTPNYYAEIPVAGAVYENLREQLPDLQVLRWHETRDLLGDDLHRIKVLFHEDGQLPPSAYQLLAKLRDQARFVLLVTILAEEAPSFSNLYGERMGEMVRHPATGEVYVFDRGVRYTAAKGSYRYMRASFTLLDLERRKRVWVAQGSAKQGFMNRESDLYWVPEVKPTGAPTPSDLFESLGADLGKKLKRL